MTTLGEAIRLVRTSEGMSQSDLASLTGLTQATLSRYESGSREPGDETLDRLSAVLGIATDVLQSLPAFGKSIAFDAHMHRDGGSKSTVWGRYEARLNMLRIHISRLAESAEVRSGTALPRFDPSEVSVAEAARRTRLRWQLPDGPIASMVDSMEDAGCFITEFPISPSRGVALSQWAEGTPVVMLDSAAPADVARETLAHELGHLVLHSEPGRASADAEREADAFAAAFLMPEREIRPALADVSVNRLYELKLEWKVSLRTLLARAHDLKVVDDRRRNSIYKMLSRRGWLAAEPLGNALPPEEPILLAWVLARLQADGYSEDEVVAIGGFSDVASANRVLPFNRL